MKKMPFPPKKGPKKPKLALLAGAALMLLPSFAHAAGVCTTVAAVTTTTQILAANDQGSYGRHYLQLQNISTAYPAWCQIGGSATVGSGWLLPPNMDAPITVPAVQQATKTFPIAPNGAVNCITMNVSGAQALVTACDW